MQYRIEPRFPCYINGECLPSTCYFVQVLIEGFLFSKWVDVKGFAMEIKTASGGLAREYIEVAAGTGLKALSDTAKEMMATSGWKGVRIGVGSNWSVWLKPKRQKKQQQTKQ